MKAKKAGEYFCNEEAKSGTDLLKVSELLLVLEISGLAGQVSLKHQRLLKRHPVKRGRQKGMEQVCVKAVLALAPVVWQHRENIQHKQAHSCFGVV